MRRAPAGWAPRPAHWRRPADPRPRRLRPDAGESTGPVDPRHPRRPPPRPRRHPRDGRLTMGSHRRPRDVRRQDVRLHVPDEPVVLVRRPHRAADVGHPPALGRAAAVRRRHRRRLPAPHDELDRAELAAGGARVPVLAVRAPLRRLPINRPARLGRTPLADRLHDAIARRHGLAIAGVVCGDRRARRSGERPRHDLCRARLPHLVPLRHRGDEGCRLARRNDAVRPNRVVVHDRLRLVAHEPPRRLRAQPSPTSAPAPGSTACRRQRRCRRWCGGSAAGGCTPWTSRTPSPPASTCNVRPG